MKRAEAFRPAVINVGIGNIDSIGRALRYLGLDFALVSDAAGLRDASHVLLPGVGAFRAGMEALAAHDLTAPLRDLAAARAVPIFGICLGMQLLGAHSEEGDCDGLNLLPYRSRRIAADGGRKVPHVGFSTVTGYADAGVFAALPSCADFYFTHSYAVAELPAGANAGTFNYGVELLAAFDAGTICGAQFHPEKSQSTGLRVLKNFFDRPDHG
ncbi:MAG: imidazole glycerol phosphate synthase subunit HisH [Pseudomonadota bacterium]